MRANFASNSTSEKKIKILLIKTNFDRSGKLMIISQNRNMQLTHCFISFHILSIFFINFRIFHTWVVLMKFLLLNKQRILSYIKDLPFNGKFERTSKTTCFNSIHVCLFRAFRNSQNYVGLKCYFNTTVISTAHLRIHF